MKIPDGGRGLVSAAMHAIKRAEEPAGRRTAKWRAFARTRGLFHTGDEGQTMIELAFALPLLLGVLMGIFSLGITFSNQLTLTQAVGAGAQYLQQIRTSTITNSDPCAATLAVIENSAPSLTPNNIHLTLTMNGTPYPGSTCANDQQYLSQGLPATVSATYPCPITIYGVQFASNCLLTAEVTEYEY